jgi:hypothetical protein
MNGIYDPTDDLGGNEKWRRVVDPKSTDEWPGTWELFDSEATTLASFRNEDGQVIRVHDGPNGYRAFVHRGGTEEWGPTISNIEDVHDGMAAYMEDNP